MRDVRDKAIDVMAPFIWSLLNKNPQETQPQPTPRMSADDRLTSSRGAASLIKRLEAANLTITAADAAPVADTVTRVMVAIDEAWQTYPWEGRQKLWLSDHVKQKVRTALTESAPDGGT